MSKDIIQMAREAGIAVGSKSALLPKLERLVRAEREACAKTCENQPMRQDIDVRDQCASAIRARGLA